MQDLTITFFQAPLVWEDIDANLDYFSHAIDQVDQRSDLLILPEMFSTGFSMNAPDMAESMNGKAVRWMHATAARTGSVVTGSVMIRDGDQFYNRLIWTQPDGHGTAYDKKHLFRYAGEEKVYTAGDARITLALNGWSIRPFICYDLRFPIWTRNLDLAYDLAIFVANWPAKRAAHWRALLRARAIENQAYVIGVNRVGTDGNGFAYSGHSAAIDPTGTVLFEKEDTPCTPTVKLDRRTLIQYREQFPAWMDSDRDLCRAPEAERRF